jgi:hypothetical protein
MSEPPLVLTPDTTSPTDAAATRALAVAVLDPLWMLARQWQTGELRAEDAGSAVGLEISLETAPFEQVETPAGTAVDTGPAEPLQLVVDAEPVPPVADRPLEELALSGLELLSCLDDHGAGSARAALLGDRYRLDVDEDLWALLEPASQRRVRAWRDRVPDPRRVVADVIGALGPTGAGPGPLPARPELTAGLDDAGQACLEAALRDWLSWLDPAPSSGPGGECWSPERLESSFALPVATSTTTVRLRAPEHVGGDLDWHTFVRAQGAGTRARDVSTRRLLPAPVRFPGMPLPRFWELEDGNLNLDRIAATRDDPGVLALVAFVHQHANDWLLIPAELPTGSIAIIRSLTVTTSFGEHIPIPPTAELDGAGSRWQLFAISPDPEAGDAPLDAASPLVLAHSAGRHLTGPVTEDLLLLRDEMANLAWAVERVTQDPAGGRVDRFARYQRRGALAWPGGGRGGPPRYRLGSTVPDFWYPLEAARDPAGRPVLALSSLPTRAAEVDDTGVCGSILDHRLGTRIHDEEVPREGALVTRRRHRARWTDGRTHTWLGRMKQAGTGEGSSGLRFDYLDADAGAGRQDWELVELSTYGDADHRTLLELSALRPGQAAFVVVRIRNRGQESWQRSGRTPVLLATVNPPDHPSVLTAPGWLSPTRPTPPAEDIVAPSDIATFPFEIRAPRVTGHFEDHFGLIVQGRGWLIGQEVTLQGRVRLAPGDVQADITPVIALLLEEPGSRQADVTPALALLLNDITPATAPPLSDAVDGVQ